MAQRLPCIRPFETEIIEEPAVFGEQTRAVIRDLDGHVIDLVTPQDRYVIPPRKSVA